MWSSFGTSKSIWSWAPPLVSHLSTQISGVLLGLFVVWGLWHGRGWAFAYTLITCLFSAILALLIQESMIGRGITVFIDLPLGVYCVLRLLGTLGPPTGGLELRRRKPPSDETN